MEHRITVQKHKALWGKGTSQCFYNLLTAQTFGFSVRISVATKIERDDEDHLFATDAEVQAPCANGYTVNQNLSTWTDSRKR
ncbi:hypothetical protein TNCV_3133301 [Trichonephila clavipes]|nr:hypothetical protein TNCV_3133301 [Trichonephila clavipes]